MKIRKNSSETDIVKSAKITHLCAATLLFLCGIWLIIFPNFGSYAVRYMLGINSLIIGGADIFGYFCNDMYRLAFQFDFGFGAFSVIVGILFLLSPAKLTVFFPYAIGLYILLDGMIKTQIAIEGKKFGIEKWQLILITGVLLALIGIGGLFCAYFDVLSVSAIGIALAADGAENFWTTMYTVHIRKKVKNVEIHE